MSGYQLSKAAYDHFFGPQDFGPIKLPASLAWGLSLLFKASVVATMAFFLLYIIYFVLFQYMPWKIAKDERRAMLKAQAAAENQAHVIHNQTDQVASNPKFKRLKVA